MAYSRSREESKSRLLVLALLSSLLGALVGGIIVAAAAGMLGERTVYTYTYLPGENVTRVITQESTVEAAYEKAAPSVVHITATTLSEGFFMRIFPQEGVGSGVVVSNEGYILTNNHVVEGAEFLKVVLPNGNETYASVVGTDPANDLAVIKIDPVGIELTPATLGNSSALHIGETVVAIGNPFGFDLTATSGIVSSLNRTLEIEENKTLYEIIQTDASINPGNSGGPLANAQGEVVGINTAIFTTTGASVGIGFAIPINRAREVMDRLIAESNATPRAWIGIYGMTLNATLAEAMNLTENEGVLVIYVVPGSPADGAGLRGGNGTIVVGSELIRTGGDLITGFNGMKIRDMQGLQDALKKVKPGDSATINYVRDGKVEAVTFRLGTRAG